MGQIKKIEGIDIANIQSIDGIDIGDVDSINGEEVASDPVFYVYISSGKTVNLWVVFPIGKTIYVDWDDGTPTQYNGTGSWINLQHTYSSGGVYNCKITGDYDTLTIFKDSETYSDFGGTLKGLLKPMVALQEADLGYGSGFSGEFTDLPSTLLKLTIENADGVTGDLADLASHPQTFTKLSLTECDNIDISSADMPDCQDYVYVWNDAITALKMDSVIIGMDNAGCSSGGYLWGKNGRTSASDTAAASLITKGWTLDLGS